MIKTYLCWQVVFPLYRLEISNVALQNANNKFELHRKISSIIKEVMDDALSKSKQFNAAFKNGQYKIVLDIRRIYEEDK